MKKIIFLLTTLFLLTGCANYINRVYTQLDQEESQIKNPKQGKNDKFTFYRKKGRNLEQQQEMEQAPRLSTLERKVVDPEVKRQYTPTTEARKRFKAEDLQDNGGSGSLWTGEGKDNSLFVSKHEKQNGDIVVINVMASLKNDITAELKKAYPSEATAPTPKAATPATAGADKAAAPAAPAGEENMTDQSKIYDKISSVVIEEINRDHILLRGRKTLLYNSRKVTVEVQALAPRKNINEDDALDSNTILESTIRVVR